MRKYYYAKEVTCPICKGVGHYLMHHDDSYYADDYEGTCLTCEGRGYINDLVDKETGYTIIEVPVEEIKVEGNVDHQDFDTVNDVIAEYYGILEYSGARDSHYSHVFVTEDWRYKYSVVKACDVDKEKAKRLVPNPIMFRGNACYIINLEAKRNGETE